MSLEQEQYPDRRFVIFNVTELNQIIFGQVFETSADTVRKSVDETKTFVKYDMPQPGKDFPETSIRVKPNQTPVTQDKGVIEKLGQQPKVTEIFKEYTYDEMLAILSTPEWTSPMTGSMP